MSFCALFLMYFTTYGLPILFQLSFVVFVKFSFHTRIPLQTVLQYGDPISPSLFLFGCDK